MAVKFCDCKTLHNFLFLHFFLYHLFLIELRQKSRENTEVTDMDVEKEDETVTAGNKNTFAF